MPGNKKNNILEEDEIIEEPNKVEENNLEEDEEIIIEEPKVIDYENLSVSKVEEELQKTITYVLRDGRGVDDLNHVAVALKRIADIYNAFKKKNEIEKIDTLIDFSTKTVYDSSNIKEEYLKEAFEEIKANKDPMQAIITANEKFLANVKEEDRIKILPSDQTYDKKKIYVMPDIMLWCKVGIDEINKAGTLDNGKLKEHINTLHHLENANEARPWYSKFWSFIKSIFTGKSETIAIDQLRNTIIEASPYSREATEKAINAKYEKQLDKLLEIDKRLLDSGEMIVENKETREQIIIDGKDLGIEEKQEEVKEEKVAPKKEEELDNDGFEFEFNENGQKVAKEEKQEDKTEEKENDLELENDEEEIIENNNDELAM